MTPLGRLALVGTARRPPEGDDPEGTLLRAAATRSIRARAGFTAPPRPVDVAPADARPPCSPAAADLLATLFAGRHADVLPEALSRLDALGLRLPHAVLPAALRCELRDRVAPVLDARGAWLAARHPDGGWVAAALAPEPTDEALEALLDASAASTRRDAARALARRGGRLADAMRARALPLVRWDGDRVVAEPPTPDPAWTRDAALSRPPQGAGERAWWLVQTLTVVAPRAWEAALGATPAAVGAAIGPDQVALADGLDRAAVLFEDDAWAAPLWAWWRLHAATGAQRELRDALAGRCAVDPVALADPDAIDTVEAARRPWSVAFGRAFLAALHARVAADADATWLRVARIGAVALPAALFADALAPWPIQAGRRAGRWREAREGFVETVRVRQRLHEVLPAR